MAGLSGTEAGYGLGSTVVTLESVHVQTGHSQQDPGLHRRCISITEVYVHNPTSLLVLRPGK